MNSKEVKKNILKNQDLPDCPGVYLMKNSSGRIIYIGKAKSLKKRVKSYFTGTHDLKSRHLLSRISSIETFETQNEVEALLLENNLIKRWKPKYNFNLKDGKTYPVIKLTNEEYPRVYRTRRIVFDGSSYFGPFPKVSHIDTYLNLIDKLFPLRKCRGRLKKRTQPCLNFHIGRCSGPCCGKISRKQYLQLVEKVRLLLSGKTNALIDELKAKMERFAGDLEYERASLYRDQIEAIETLSEEQKVVDFHEEARDYLGFCSADSLAGLAILQMRGGKLIGRDHFLLEAPTAFRLEDEAKMLTDFLGQYYSGMGNLPRTLYLDTKSSINADTIGRFLSRLLGRKITVKLPQRGKHRQVVIMAEQFAAKKLEQSIQRQSRALESLQRLLDLDVLPRRIEGFDIAHLSGQQTVASMVSFKNGLPDKSRYRRYHIRSTAGLIDDFKAIREVVTRRYSRLQNENRKMPDLILVDGGRGQVSSALAVLRALDLSHLPIVGLAKKKEELFLPGRKVPLILEEASEALLLLQSVRDEAHRFATSFHKVLRKRNTSSSILEQVKGIGKKKSQMLLKRFGSIKEISSREPAEIAGAGGLGISQALALLEFLKR